MKILKLHLQTFDSFSNLLLDFSSGQEGIHLVYGSTEARKTTALRALYAMLFGFTRQSINPLSNKKYKVGGRLKQFEGKELEFTRQNTQQALEGSDGQSLSSEAFKPFLNGISQEYFASFFGITREALVQGGESILKSSKGLANSLFGTGIGNEKMDDLLYQLEKEASALYFPQSNQGVNKAINAYLAAQNQCNEASLSGQAWLQLGKAFNSNRKQIEKISKSIEEYQAQIQRLENAQKALPLLEEYKVFVSELKKFGEIIDLPDNFLQTYRETIQSIKETKATKAAANEELVRLDQAIQDRPLSESFLQQGPLILDLNQRIDDYRETASNYQRLQTEIQQLEQDSELLLKQLGPNYESSSLETQRITLADRLSIQELGDQFKSLSSHLKDHEDLIERQKLDLATLKQELEQAKQLPTFPHLNATIRNTEKYKQLENEISSGQTQYQRDLQEAQIALKQLPGWESSLEELEVLPVPSVDTVNRFDSDLKQIDYTLNTLKQYQSRIRAEVRELDRQLKELEFDGHEFSIKDLESIRHRRDKDWQGIRMALAEKPTKKRSNSGLLFNPSLEEEFEKSMHKADFIADRLRLDAERLARQTSLLAQKEKHQAELAQIKSELSMNQKQLRTIREEWKTLWEDLQIDPLPPPEMRGWLQKQQQLLQMAQSLRQSEQHLAEIQEQIAIYRQKLVAGLQEAGMTDVLENMSLSDLLEQAETFYEQLQNQIHQREEQILELRQLESEHQITLQKERRLQQDHKEWQTQWRTAMKTLQLPESTLPDAAKAVMDSLESLLNKLDEKQKFETQCSQLILQMERFEKDAEPLISQLASDMAEEPLTVIIPQLHQYYEQMQQDWDEVSDYQQQSQHYQEQLQEAETALETLQNRLNELIHQSGGSSEEDLVKMESYFQQTGDIQNNLKQLETQLMEHAAGMELDKFVAMLQTINPQSLPEQIARVHETITSLTSQQQTLVEKNNHLAQKIQQLEGSSEAAEAAENAQHSLVQIRTEINRYLQVKLASKVLRQAIEHYQESQHAPIVQAAKKFFIQLTLGAYSNLQTDFHEKTGQPIYVGIQADGTPVKVEKMSNSVREQLYLALRLAHLQEYNTTQEPIPFIINGLLVNFDDQRAAALLQILTELSNQTQILLFTHHLHFLTLAKNQIPENTLFIHTLSTSPQKR